MILLTKLYLALIFKLFTLILNSFSLIYKISLDPLYIIKSEKCYLNNRQQSWNKNTQWMKMGLLDSNFLIKYFRGSYAKVVKGREKGTGKPVAIKIIKKYTFL